MRLLAVLVAFLVVAFALAGHSRERGGWGRGGSHQRGYYGGRGGYNPYGGYRPVSPYGYGNRGFGGFGGWGK